LTDEKLLGAAGDRPEVFSDVERLVIELADAMAEIPTNISDDLYGRLRAQFSWSCRRRSLSRIFARA